MRQVKLYLDSFLIAEFWLHVLCLKLCELVVSANEVKCRRIRIFLAAVSGALSDLFGPLFLTELYPARIVLAAADLVIASVIAFGKYRVIRTAGILFLATALLGGVFSTFRIRNTGLFCLGGCVLLAFGKGIAEHAKRRTTEQGFRYMVKLWFAGEERSFSAFLDTGNRLKLHGSDAPVMVAGKRCIEDWVKKAELFLPQKYICLPFCGVGGKGLLFGVRAECRITKEDGRVVYEGKTAVVNADLKQFAEKGFDLLLQPEFFRTGTV